MTLWETFLHSTQPRYVKWRIYDRASRKLLCADYGSLKAEDESLDNAEVHTSEVKFSKRYGKYVRAVVIDA